MSMNLEIEGAPFGKVGPWIRDDIFGVRGAGLYRKYINVPRGNAKSNIPELLQKSFNVDHSVRIPTEQEIVDKCKTLYTRDPCQDSIIYLVKYKDAYLDDTFYKEMRFNDSDFLDDKFVDHILPAHLNNIKKEIAKEVIKLYNEKILKEECNMKREDYDILMKRVTEAGASMSIDLSTAYSPIGQLYDPEVTITVSSRNVAKLLGMGGTPTPNCRPKTVINHPTIPAITDIAFYNNRVTKVTFADGTFTKAVCGENDTFSKDVGITVCLLKKLLGGQERGTKAYMKMLESAHKCLVEKIVKRRKDEQAKIEKKMDQHKADMKRKAKKLKKKEEAIDIQKQGYLRAMQEMERGCMARGDDLK